MSFSFKDNFDKGLTVLALTGLVLALVLTWYGGEQIAQRDQAFSNSFPATIAKPKAGLLEESTFKLSRLTPGEISPLLGQAFFVRSEVDFKQLVKLQPDAAQLQELFPSGLQVQLPPEGSERFGDHSKPIRTVSSYIFIIENDRTRFQNMAVTHKVINTMAPYRAFLVQPGARFKLRLLHEHDEPQARLASSTHFASVKPWTRTFQIFPNKRNYLVITFYQEPNAAYNADLLEGALEIGFADDVLQRDRRDMITTFITIGVFLMIAFYNFSLFLQRREDIPSLVIAVMMVAILLRYLVTERIMPYSNLDEDIFGFAFIPTAALNIIVWLFFGFTYLVFEDVKSPFAMKLTAFASLGITLVVTINQGDTAFLGPYGELLFTLMPLTTMFALLGALSLGVFRQEQGAIIALIGTLLAFLAHALDFLKVVGALEVPIWLGQYGFAGLCVCLSLIVGNNFANTFRRTKLLSEDLREKNAKIIEQNQEIERKNAETRMAQDELITVQKRSIEELDRKVREKTRDIREILAHIKQGIFTFREDFQISEEHSDYLRELLGCNELAGRDMRDVLLSRSDLTANELNTISTVFEYSFGQDSDLGWEANRDAIRTEFLYKSDDGLRTFEADYSVIVDEDTQEVEKFLVALRDVTLLKQLEASAELKDREIGMLMEMLSNDLTKTRKFIERSLAKQADIQHLIDTYDLAPSEHFNELYRIYHTIKGNALSLGFVGISDAVHETEEKLKPLRYQHEAYHLRQFLLDSNRLFEFIRQYDALYHSKFEKILMDARNPDQGILFESFFEESVVSGLNKLAEGLGKQRPRLRIQNPQGFHVLGDEVEEIFGSVFNHIARNSIDHGIELPDERRQWGKPEFGTIYINVDYQKNRYLNLVYRDDGRGLNLRKIYQKAKDQQLLDEVESLEQLANMIFKPSFSTAERTTDISGRGVGMDAVKHYLESMGASIKLVLHTGNRTEQDIYESLAKTSRDEFIPFEFHIHFASIADPTPVDSAS